MVALVLTAAFGVLGILSIYFARRDEEGHTFFWTMATLCALAFGFSLGSFNQDAQLRNEIAALTARLEPSAEPVEASAADSDESFTARATTEPPTTPEPPTPTEPPVVTKPPTSPEPPVVSPDPQPDAETASATPPTSRPAADLPEADSPEPAPVSEPPVTPTLSGAGAAGKTVTPVAEPAVPLSELAGSWEMTTTIERTAYPAYAGLMLTFRLGVAASGPTLNAVGNKAAERAPDAERILTYAPSAANRIVLTGAYADADTLALSFEEGTQGQGGTMTLEVVSPERLEGVFVSSAGTSGSALWRKLRGTD